MPHHSLQETCQSIPSDAPHERVPSRSWQGWAQVINKLELVERPELVTILRDAAHCSKHPFAACTRLDVPAKDAVAFRAWETEFAQQQATLQQVGSCHTGQLKGGLGSGLYAGAWAQATLHWWISMHQHGPLAPLVNSSWTSS